MLNFKNKSEIWTRSEDGLPDAGVLVDVVMQEQDNAKAYLSTDSFKPTKGWASGKIVHAWKMLDNKVVKILNEINKTL